MKTEEKREPDPLVSLRQVTKSYGANAVLKGVDLDIKSGEFLTLLGPSGCGKTTILRIVAGFETPSSGDLTLQGRRINDLPPEKREVNTVFQSYALFPHLTIFENVAFGLRIKNSAESEIQEKVHAALEMVKLSHLKDRFPKQLSGGQQQRIAIARAVVNRPVLLLLDESLSALDYKLRKEMQIELKQLQRKLGITFVFVTHDQEEALSMSDRIVVMHKGVIQQIGTPEQIYESPANLFVASFIGEATLFDSVVESSDSGMVHLMVEGSRLSLKFNSPVRTGNRLKILVRPEDLRVERIKDSHSGNFCFDGIVEQIIYRGTMIDLRIRLPGGSVIQASEFYNEDSDALGYSVGQMVYVAWVPGWEVMLDMAEAGLPLNEG